MQIYEENRKLVVSDTRNLERICQEITDALKRGTYHLKNKIDMHHGKAFKEVHGKEFKDAQGKSLKERHE